MIIGTGAGGIDIGERQYAEFFGDGWRRVTPYAIPVSICGMVSSEISIALGLFGMSHVLSTGCTSSPDAIGYACSALHQGDAEVLLAGGADACVTPGMVFGFSRMKGVATRFNDSPESASRPLDRDRDGFVLGEGAWMLVLETEARARSRGARIYACVEGYASTCDAYHRVQMDPGGAQIVRAMRLAVERSGRAPEEIRPRGGTAAHPRTRPQAVRSGHRRLRPAASGIPLAGRARQLRRGGLHLEPQSRPGPAARAGALVR